MTKCLVANITMSCPNTLFHVSFICNKQRERTIFIGLYDVVHVYDLFPACKLSLYIVPLCKKKNLVSSVSYRAASYTRAETQGHEEVRMHGVWLQVHQTGRESPNDGRASHGVVLHQIIFL